MSTTIDIYGKKDCPHCAEAKTLVDKLNEKGIKTIYHAKSNMSEDDWEVIKDNSEMKTVPVVYMKGPLVKDFKGKDDKKGGKYGDNEQLQAFFKMIKDTPLEKPVDPKNKQVLTEKSLVQEEIRFYKHVLEETQKKLDHINALVVN